MEPYPQHRRLIAEHTPPLAHPAAAPGTSQGGPPPSSAPYGWPPAPPGPYTGASGPPPGRPGPRARRRWLLVLALALALALASTVVVIVAKNNGTDANSAAPPGVPAAAETTPAGGPELLPPEHQVMDRQMVRQDLGTGPAKTFGGTAIYDACTALPMTALAAAGFVFGGNGPSEVQSARILRDNPHDPAAVTEDSGSGATACRYYAANGDYLTVQLHQLPYDQLGWRADVERVLRKNHARETTVGGWPALYRQDADPALASHWDAMLLAEPAWASIQFRLTATTQPAETVVTAVLDTIARGLRSPPTGPSRHVFTGTYHQVPPPCELFRTEDFEQALGIAADGRPEEKLSLIERPLYPAPTMAQIPMAFVSSECTQRNQAAVNRGVGDTPAQGMTLRFSNFLTEEMAANSNDYDCDPGSRHKHPYGPPKKIPFAVGDGASCLVNMGDQQSPLAFKAGKTTVKISMWSPRQLGDDATAIRVYSTIANTISTRLTG